MKKWRRNFSTGTIVTIMAFSIAPTTSFAQISSPQVYVALGDSVAAGATPYEELDAGYSDIIANKLSQNGLLAGFSKDFAVPGFATGDVLELLETEEVKQSVESATLITLSAGANNVLGLVQQDANGRTVQFDQLTANFILNQMRVQYGELLDEIQSINPDAELYALGYYFPYPNVLQTQQQGVRKMLDLVNQIIENEANSRGVPFIDVAERFDPNGEEYLPNPTDVHPTQQGYLSIANSFFDVVDDRFSVSENDIPPNPGMSPFIEQLLEENQNQQAVTNENIEEEPIENEEMEEFPEEELESADGEAFGPKPYPSPIQYVAQFS